MHASTVAYKFYFQFAILLGIVFLFGVVGAVLAFLFKDDFEKRAEKELKTEGIKRYRDDPDWYDFVNWVQETVSFYKLSYHRFDPPGLVRCLQNIN